MEQRKIRRQGGFTLIELITVIIILGILAAVIAPRYFSMADEAQQAAYQGALSEGVARFNMAYAKFVLDTGAAPAALANLGTATYLGADLSTVDVGDFNLAYTGGAAAGGGGVGDVTITALRTGDTAADVAAFSSTTFAWPE